MERGRHGDLCNVDATTATSWAEPTSGVTELAAMSYWV